MSLFLKTRRLELVPATVQTVRAQLHGRNELPRLMQVKLGRGWPPPLCDVRALRRVERALESDPALGGWTMWYWILQESRAVIGVGGFKDRPFHQTVEIGYNVLSAYQRRGFATEALGALVSWAFQHEVECVIAETLPELIASQRTLVKLGFVEVGQASEPGVVRYERRRDVVGRAGQKPLE